MNVRYLQTCYYWEAKAKLLDSGSWKQLIGLKDEALGCMKKIIGNCNSTSLWFEPWLDEGRLIDYFDHDVPNLSNTTHMKVSYIINEHQWSLNIPAISTIWNSIINVDISDYEDYWIWRITKDGKFSLFSAWNKVRHSDQIFTFHDVVWFSNSSPKMATCLLKALLNRLPTRDRLLRFDMVNNSSCVLCENGVESGHHLFFECPFSKYLWTLCRLKLKLQPTPIGNLENEAELIQQNFKTKDKTFKLARSVFSATVWHVWQERNRRVFQGQKMHKIMVFRRIYEDVNLLLRTCIWKVNNKEFILANWGLEDHCICSLVVSFVVFDLVNRIGLGSIWFLICILS